MPMPRLVEGTIITIDIEPTISGDFSKFAGDVRRRARSLKPWFTQIMLPLALDMERKQYETWGGYSGPDIAAMWYEEYSKRYRKWKLKKVGHLERGVLSGRLRDSLTMRTRYTELEIRKDRFSFGSRARDRHGFVYVGVQEGVPYWAPKRGRGKTKKSQRANRDKDYIQPRPPVVTRIPERVIDEIQASIITYLARGIMVPPEA
jgi:hypothetical protein